MKHALSVTFIFLFLLLGVVVFNTVHAASASRPFGGRIVNTKATEIQTLEGSNYRCVVPGTTITIKPINSSSPTTFLIPAGVTSKTRTTPRAGQQIKGLYSQSKTTITCTYQGYPPSQTTTTLTPITLYGTSRN